MRFSPRPLARSCILGLAVLGVAACGSVSRGVGDPPSADEPLAPPLDRPLGPTTADAERGEMACGEGLVTRVTDDFDDFGQEATDDTEVPASSDIAQARVLVGKEGICWEIETVAEPAADEPVLFKLAMREPGKDDSGGLIALEVQGPITDDRIPSEYLTSAEYLVSTNAPDPANLVEPVDLPPDADSLPQVPSAVWDPRVIVVDGDVERDGRTLSVFAPFSIFDPSARELVTDFEWTSTSVWSSPDYARPPYTGEQYLDCAPIGNDRVGLEAPYARRFKGQPASTCFE